MSSLRYRLLFALLAGLVFAGIAGGIGLYWQSREELGELFDDRLQDLGDNLNSQTLAQYRPVDPDEPDDDIVIQHWSGQGQLLYQSNQYIKAPIPRVLGLEDLNGDGHDWRSYSRRTTDGGMLQIAQEMAARREIAAESTTRLLLPLLCMIPLIGLFSAWTVSRQLKPLRSLAEQMSARDALSRTDVQVEHAPTELEPVVNALNALLTRQAEALQRQQAFLADAAHELRTPMAVLNLQVQQAQQPGDAEDHASALAALQAGVDRASRLVSQLLALARSEPLATTVDLHEKIALDALVRAVVAELYPLASQKSIDLGVVRADACEVRGDAEGLRSLLTNLVDNAIRYTPAQGRVDVSLQQSGDSVSLRVSDSGPGIPLENRRRVFERFVRGGAGDSLGTGLGLAIARQVVETHAGSIALETGPEGRGLCVHVRLPNAV